MLTYNFLPASEERAKKADVKYRDQRNGITCANPSLDIECYINYIDLLNLHRDKWVNYGYLDLGMMPLAMAPSFMQGVVSQAMSTVANKLGIPIYSMPAVSLFFERCSVGENDIWVFKKDIAQVMKTDESKVSLGGFLRWSYDITRN